MVQDRWGFVASIKQSFGVSHGMGNGPSDFLSSGIIFWTI
jgi:hypothetical protein